MDRPRFSAQNEDILNFRQENFGTRFQLSGSFAAASVEQGDFSTDAETQHAHGMTRHWFRQFQTRSRRERQAGVKTGRFHSAIMGEFGRLRISVRAQFKTVQDGLPQGQRLFVAQA